MRILCVSSLARAGCGPLYSVFAQLASCSRADAMKGVVTRPSRGLPKCSKRGCANDAVSHRAKFCAACFTENACVAGRKGRGNTKVGKPKKEAGKRSGVKRSARYALVVKKEWLDKILFGQKDWEIRGSATARRGWGHLAESKAGGVLVGRACVVDCMRIARSMCLERCRHHCVRRVSMVQYRRIFAWVLKGAERYKVPLRYGHSNGAVIWSTAWGE